MNQETLRSRSLLWLWLLPFLPIKQVKNSDRGLKKHLRKPNYGRSDQGYPCRAWSNYASRHRFARTQLGVKTRKGTVSKALQSLYQGLLEGGCQHPDSGAVDQAESEEPG